MLKIGWFKRPLLALSHLMILLDLRDSVNEVNGWRSFRICGLPHRFVSIVRIEYQDD
jgi:hypothetical protein